MRVKAYRLQNQVLVSLFKKGMENSFYVSQGIPADGRIIFSKYDKTADCTDIFVESASFPEIQTGASVQMGETIRLESTLKELYQVNK